MKLYIFDFCPFCMKASFVASFLKNPIDTYIMLEGEHKEHPEMIGGYKVLPVLVKDNGDFLPESDAVVKYLNTCDQDEPAILLADHEMVDKADQLTNSIRPTTFWNLSQLDLKSLSTAKARQMFIDRLTHEKSFQNIYKETLVSTQQKIDIFAEDFHPKGVFYNGERPSFNDVNLFPILNTASIITNIRLPKNIQEYLHHIAQKITFPMLADYSVLSNT